VHVTPLAPLDRRRIAVLVACTGAVTFDRGRWITGEFRRD